MILGRVTGNVVGTIKHPSFEGRKLMIVQPIASDGKDTGARFLAVDHAQAGPGDRVIVLGEGSGIRQITGDSKSPVRALIVGIVDDVNYDDATGTG
jgi:ethanolamine utilization protein EutN